MKKDNKGVNEQHENQKTHQERDVDLRDRSARLVDSRRSDQRVAGHVLSADAAGYRQGREVLSADRSHHLRHSDHSRTHRVHLPHFRRRHRSVDRVVKRPQYKPERTPHSVYEARGDSVRRDRGTRVLRAAGRHHDELD